MYIVINGEQKDRSGIAKSVIVTFERWGDGDVRLLVKDDNDDSKTYSLFFDFEDLGCAVRAVEYFHGPKEY